MKFNIVVLIDIFSKTPKEIGLDLCYNVRLPGYTWQYELKKSLMRLKTNHDQDSFHAVESNNTGGKSSIREIGR